jgi:LacI family transcriptional regulator
MRLLTKLMNKDSVEQSQVVLPHEIIRRQSTRSL